MLGWAFIFLLFSLISAIFGFSGIAATSAWIAQILFYFFIGLFIISLLAGILRSGNKAIK